MGRTLSSNAGSAGPASGWEAKISHALARKKKKKLNRNNVINSIKTVEISLKRNLYRDAEKAKYQ